MFFHVHSCKQQSQVTSRATLLLSGHMRCLKHFRPTTHVVHVRFSQASQKINKIIHSSRPIKALRFIMCIMMNLHLIFNSAVPLFYAEM